ncbi:hypothetical protein TcBrA4_0038500 [Trypanosoma cruzi]|nr:hypothetical protein TcBrA4_0038500 [Trypanosoma cruzi]
MSRDVAEALVSFKPLRRLAHTPYSKEREEEFLSIGMGHEDMMVGHVLLEEVKYQPLIHVKVLPCHSFKPVVTRGNLRLCLPRCVSSRTGGRLRSADGALRQRHFACCPSVAVFRRRNIPLV